MDKRIQNILLQALVEATKPRQDVVGSPILPSQTQLARRTEPETQLATTGGPPEKPPPPTALAFPGDGKKPEIPGVSADSKTSPKTRKLYVYGPEDFKYNAYDLFFQDFGITAELERTRNLLIYLQAIFNGLRNSQSLFEDLENESFSQQAIEIIKNNLEKSYLKIKLQDLKDQEINFSLLAFIKDTLSVFKKDPKYYIKLNQSTNNILKEIDSNNLKNDRDIIDYHYNKLKKDKEFVSLLADILSIITSQELKSAKKSKQYSPEKGPTPNVKGASPIGPDTSALMPTNPQERAEKLKYNTTVYSSALSLGFLYSEILELDKLVQNQILLKQAIEKNLGTYFKDFYYEDQEGKGRLNIKKRYQTFIDVYYGQGKTNEIKEKLSLVLKSLTKEQFEKIASYTAKLATEEPYNIQKYMYDKGYSS